MYPVSNPFDGQALNITCTSYINTLNFGFTGCRDSLPHMQHLAIYMGDALIELEAAYGLSGDETSPAGHVRRSEEHTSELQSLMRISYAVFCLTKKKHYTTTKPS